ncbi:hypothetical protein CH248_27465 [Rhodococcus sp. 06-156-4a]|nr:hypothetical protein CH248_27465 [Rhodococcus sp. 06-156-4a]
MLPEQRLDYLQALATWSAHHLRLQELIGRDSTPSLSDLGVLAWLRVFDSSDLREFVSEVHDALIASTADQSARALEETVEAWRVTASELEDPLRRSVLMRPVLYADLVDAERPDEP